VEERSPKPGERLINDGGSGMMDSTLQSRRRPAGPRKKTSVSVSFLESQISEMEKSILPGKNTSPAGEMSIQSKPRRISAICRRSAKRGRVSFEKAPDFTAPENLAQVDRLTFWKLQGRSVMVSLVLRIHCANVG
jgi:hypothetical protein